MRYPSYPSYRPSDVEWLGDLPEHWEKKAIKWESPVLRGASPRPIDDPKFFDDEGEYAWVRISDVTAAGMYLSETEQRLSTLGSSLSVKLQPGSLFLSIAATVGKPAITKIKCCIHDGFVFFPRFKGDPRFLFYVFASGEPYKGLGKLGTQLNLNTDTVGSIIAGFPQTSEQHAIADFLDAETAKLDTLVAKKRELIEKLKEKRTALISRTVTRGLPPEAARAAGLSSSVIPGKPEGRDPESKGEGKDWIPASAGMTDKVRFKPTGIEWLGDIPEHWDVCKFSRDIHVAEGQIDPEVEPYASMLLIAPNHIESGTKRLIGKETAAEQGAESGKYLCRAGEVIYSKIRPALAKATIAPEDCLCSADMYPLSGNQRFENRYICWVLLSQQFTAWSVLESDRVAMPKINRETLNELRMPVPPVPEQRAIANYLDRETMKIDRMIEKVKEATERLQEYRTALITAAVTGKIDVRGYARRTEAA